MSSHHRHHAEAHEHGHRHVEEDMLSVEEAYHRIMASFSPLQPVELPLLETLGHVLAVDITSPLDLPPAANSGMDGYAVRQEDIQSASPGSPQSLKVIGLVAAGQVPHQFVEPGTAIRIMTGATIPEGADTVVPFEETDEVQRRTAGRPLEEVSIMTGLPFGSNVRPAGEDVGQGQLVLEAGTVVRAAEVGVMASLGMERVRVTRSPVVAILATGDELSPAGQSLGGGQIYDSNSFSVAASVINCGGIPKPLGIAKDSLADLNQKLEAASEADLVITSAGVSKGDYDIVKDALTQRGEMNFWSVRMRPAKPLAFGHLRRDHGDPVPILGLPGNPVSAMVAFEMFARPAIRTMMGRKRLPRPTVEGVLTGPIFNADGRRVYARVEVERRNGTYYATPSGPQGSNILSSMSRANGLAICPENLRLKRAGERVRIIMLDWNEEVDL
jgi:molybdopterin molybdotransferase